MVAAEQPLPVLRAERLTRTLTGEVPVTLVDDVELEARAGELIIITGPSGSGKSSLLYLLGLLDVPTAGRVWLNGVDTSRYRSDELAAVRLSGIGFVFQFHFLLPEFTALENVMLPMQRLSKLRRGEMTIRAEELLERVGMQDQRHKLPRQLSGGQSQRVAICRALANDPALILADEPTGNLDTAASETVRGILHQLAHEHGRTVLVVTHDATLDESPDRKIVIVDGRIVSEA